MKQTLQKVLWLSKNKLMFEWETVFGIHFPWGYQELGKKKALVIAEEGKDLFFINKGEEGGYFKDLLCWFCQNSISLGKFGYAPTCLLGKPILEVTVCRNFVPGLSFGKNKERDIGVRLRRAETILPKIEWNNPSYCKFYNPENILRILGDTEKGPVIEEQPCTRFCEILNILPKPTDCRTCEHFEISEDPQRRNLLEDRKSALNDYMTCLKSLEKEKEQI